MATDIFEQLAERDVPPPPREFDHTLHQRLNRRLLVVQLAEFAVLVPVWVAWRFAKAFGGLNRYTIMGRFEDRRRGQG